MPWGPERRHADGVPAAGVAGCERTYFDGRVRLRATDWVTFRAVGARSLFPADDPGPLLQAVGYHGGPLMLDLVLAAVAGRPRRRSFWIAAE